MRRAGAAAALLVVSLGLGTPARAQEPPPPQAAASAAEPPAPVPPVITGGTPVPPASPPLPPPAPAPQLRTSPLLIAGVVTSLTGILGIASGATVAKVGNTQAESTAAVGLVIGGVGFIIVGLALVSIDALVARRTPPPPPKAVPAVSLGPRGVSLRWVF